MGTKPGFGNVTAGSPSLVVSKSQVSLWPFRLQCSVQVDQTHSNTCAKTNRENLKRANLLVSYLVHCWCPSREKSVLIISAVNVVRLGERR